MYPSSWVRSQIHRVTESSSPSHSGAVSVSSPMSSSYLIVVANGGGATFEDDDDDGVDDDETKTLAAEPAIRPFAMTV